MQCALAVAVQVVHLLRQVAVVVQVVIRKAGLTLQTVALLEQVAQLLQVVHQMVYLAKQLFMEW
jgi:hypothetical protein